MIKVILGPNMYNYLQRLNMPIEQLAALYKTNAIVYSTSALQNDTWKIVVDVEDKKLIPIITQKVRQYVVSLLPSDGEIRENQNSIPC